MRLFDRTGCLVPASLTDPLHRFPEFLHRCRVREPDPAGHREGSARGYRLGAGDAGILGSILRRWAGTLGSLGIGFQWKRCPRHSKILFKTRIFPK